MDFSTLANQASIDKTIAALSQRGVTVELVADKAAALAAIKNYIPAGAEVMTGGSTTLDQIGFTDVLKSGQHPWKNLKDAIMAEQDKAKQADLRRQSILSQYWLGSVHALTEAGQTITASGTGSQLPAYAFSSPNVVWVVGAQKIVPNLELGFQRLKEYVFPLEDQRMKSIGYPGASISKVLIFERETMPNRKIHLILVQEALGF